MKEEMRQRGMTANYAGFLKAGLSLLLAAYWARCAWEPGAHHYIDGVNLVAHEAGHLLFSFIGEFITVAGGTLGQLFVPVAFTVYFASKREYWSSTVTLGWAGENLSNISVYIKDARTMTLPLVTAGGDGDVIHDWNWMLGRLHLLRHDQLIGNTVYGLGIIVIAAAVILGLKFALRKEMAEDRLKPTAI